MKIIKEIIPYLIIIVVVILIRTFIITPVRVDGASMDKTLENGQILLLYKLGSIKRFDIVVLDEEIEDEIIIKRIIGMPNDTVEIKNGKIYVNDEEIEEEYDVVVIGAGGAGFSAAIEAKNAGANVIILEKMPAVGGNTLISGAEYAAPNNWLQKEEGLEDSVDLMVEDMLVGGDNKNNPELVRVVAENALDGALWLKDEVGVIWEDELMFFGGHSV